jgi:cytochrome P450
MSASRPPGPRDWSLGIRTLGRIKADVLGFYTAAHRTYGDAVYMRFGPFHTFTFYHPDQVREVLAEKAKHFTRMWRQVQVFRQWNGNGLSITDGDPWLRQRRLVQPAFHQARLARYAGAITAVARERLAAAAGPVGFDTLMTDLTMDVITRTMFGTDLGGARADLARALKVLNDVAMRELTAPATLPDWLPLPGKREKRWAIRTLDGTVRRFVAERRKAGADAGDLLSMLLLAADEDADGGGFTDEQARDECVGIFLAGHGTAAAAMTWVGWALAAHPDVMARAAAEVDSVLGGRDPAFADLPRLTYTERVVKEALRLWPPAFAMFTRQAARDTEVGGWPVPKGSSVHLFSWVTHRDPRWFPDPEAFDPDRFAPGRIENIPPGAYFPFGLGPRACVGNHFAMTELTFLTTMLVQRFTLAPAPGQGVPVPAAGMALRPAGGLRLALTPRG